MWGHSKGTVCRAGSCSHQKAAGRVLVSDSGLQNRAREAKVCVAQPPRPSGLLQQSWHFTRVCRTAGSPRLPGRGRGREKKARGLAQGRRPLCLNGTVTEQAAHASNSPSLREALVSSWMAVEPRKCCLSAARGPRFTPSLRSPVFLHERLRLVLGSLGFHKAIPARVQRNEFAPVGWQGPLLPSPPWDGAVGNLIFLRSARLILRGARLFTRGIK